MHDAYVTSTQCVTLVTHALRHNINNCCTQRHAYEYERNLKKQTKNNKISRTTFVLAQTFGTIITINTNATLLRGKGWLIRI